MADDQTNPLNNLPQDNQPAAPQDPAGGVPQDNAAPAYGSSDAGGALNVEHGAAPAGQDEPTEPAAPENPVPEEPSTPAPGGDDASGDQNPNQAL